MKIIKLMNFIDNLSEWIGVIISWIIIPLTAVVIYEILLRYVFNNPTGWVYDTVWMLCSVLVLIGGPYTLLHKGHVRIDVIYSRFFTIRGQIIFDIIFFVVIFIPVMTLFTVKGIQYAIRAWTTGETLSTSVWNFPVGPIKTVIPVSFLLMGLQGIAELIRNFIALKKGKRL